MLLINWIVLSLAVWITAYLLPGVAVNGLAATIITALVIGIVNTFIKPVFLLLTLPLNILTLGLFTFVINALMIMLVASIVPDFRVDSFWWAMLFSFVLSVVSSILGAMIK